MKHFNQSLIALIGLIFVGLPATAAAEDCYGTYEVSWRTADSNATDFSAFQRAGRFADTGDCRAHDKAIALVKKIEARGDLVRLVQRFMGSITVVFQSSNNNTTFGIAKARDSRVLYAKAAQPTEPVARDEAPTVGPQASIQKDTHLLA